MFLIRSVHSKDLEYLYELSKLENFINLPQNKEILKKNIANSEKAFLHPDQDKSKNYFVFVLENTETKEIIGVSLIHGQHGTDEEPHFYFRVTQEERFSKTINTGFIHGILELDFEPNGYTEVGGLVLHPDYRGNKAKLGKQISFSRFLFMGLRPELFTKVVHAELLPPLDKDGNPPLWEAIGRKFTNMDYHEADKLSRVNKEFILSLFPQQKIYKALLPIVARNNIGKVGTSTEPVKKMMENIGFKYMNEVDPFDGGPHYRCLLSDIKPIKNLKNLVVKIKDKVEQTNPVLMTLDLKDYAFSCTMVMAQIKDDVLVVDQTTAASLKLSENFKTSVIML